jgi:large subunit ribosomal protein L10
MRKLLHSEVKEMATKQFKSDKIDVLKSKLDKAQVAILTEYKGYSVEEITNLRRALQKENGDYMVTKNTLAKIAVKGTEFEVLTDAFKGSIALAFGFEDQVSPAKIMAKFIKESKKGAILGGALDGKLLTAEEAQALAKLPSKEELIARLLGSINSPATGIVGSMNAVMASLTRAVAAVRDKKAA